MYLGTLNTYDAIEMPRGIEEEGDRDRLGSGGNPALFRLGIDMVDMSL